MSSALTPPFIVAAVLLCVAGARKLRSPEVAADAIRVLGLPGSRWTVRALAAGELVLGAACAVHPTPATAAVLAATYATFAAVVAALIRRRAACGCFGVGDVPASTIQSIASALVGAVALGAAVAPAHGLAWVMGRPGAQTAVLLIGIAGGLYGTVLVYTQAPAAWAAWGGQ